MTHLNQLPNSFEAVNHVRCFNHTMQLSAKALLKPFSASPKDDNTTEGSNDDNNAEVGLKQINEGGDYDNNEDEGGDEPMDDGDEEEEEDPFEMLDEVDHEQLMKNTVAVCATLNKACIVILCLIC